MYKEQLENILIISVIYITLLGLDDAVAVGGCEFKSIPLPAAKKLSG